MATHGAYLVVIARITDRGKMAEYGAALAASGLYPAHGGEYRLIGRAAVPLEDWQDEAVVVAHFPDRAAAEAFWWSSDYQEKIKPLRAGAGEFRVAIFDAAASQ